MRRAISVHTRGHWPAEAAIDTVTLPFLDRHRRRIRLVADSGTPFLLDLARAQHLTEGDGLEPASCDSGCAWSASTVVAVGLSSVASGLDSPRPTARVRSWGFRASS